MKKILVALILLCAGYWAAVNQEKLKSWWQSAQSSAGDRFEHPLSEDENSGAPDKVPSSTPAPSPPHTPQPTVATTPPPAPSPTSAPPSLPALETGVFYTRERVSQMTDAGIAAIPERTKVRQVGEQDGMLIVEAAGKRVTVSRDKLTNDPAEVAALLKENEAQAQALLLANQPKPPPPPPDPKAVKEANYTKRRVLRTQINEIDRRIFDLNNHVYLLRSQAGDAKSRGRPSTFNDKAIATTLGQINELTAQSSKLKLEEAAIPY
jgi:hypothetical protein